MDLADDAITQVTDRALSDWGSFAITLAVLVAVIWWLLSRNKSLETRNQALTDQMFAAQKEHSERMIGVLEKSREQARALADAVKIIEKLGR